jgi:DNA-binding response OmpR family regulator
MHLKVLVVEDDQLTRQGLSEVLAKEGYWVIQAATGTQGWDCYCEESPDFVCLDVMMPGLSGYELCKKIRRENTTVPIIFLTAKSEEIDRVLGLELGGDDYISKPFGTKEVVARIRAVSRRALSSCLDTQPSDRIPESFQLFDLVVFPRQLRATREKGVWIDLSFRDIKILHLLWKNKNQVVDRRMLMSDCWDQRYLPSSRSLDQHISQLRKRIELNPKDPSIIKTVHGTGYRFDG